MVPLAATELALAANRVAGQVLLGQSDPDTTPGENGTGAEFGKSAPIALVIILVLLVSLVLLIRSMNRHVRTMPESFDPPATSAEPDER